MFAPHRFFNTPANGLEQPAPQGLQDRLALAFADHHIRGMAQKTAFRVTEFARKASLDHVMQTAVQSADPTAGNSGVLAALETAFVDVSRQLADWNNASTISQQRARQRTAETNHLVIRAMNILARKRGEIEYIDSQLFSKVPYSDKAERLRNAGLTQAELDTLGVLPPEIDAEKLSRQRQIISSEIEALNTFTADPLRRISLLGDIDLDASDDADRKRVEKLAEADAKQAVADGEKHKTKKQSEAARLAAEKAAKDAPIVDRAILLKATKQRELNELQANILAARSRPSTNPELISWRQKSDSIQKDIDALNDFCGDYPNFRIEKARGLLDEAVAK